MQVAAKLYELAGVAAGVGLAGLAHDIAVCASQIPTGPPKPVDTVTEQENPWPGPEPAGEAAQEPTGDFV